MNNQAKSILKIGDTNIKITWNKTKEINDYSPITQVYGIIFNSENKILICRETSEDKWQIPGGKPEEKENLEEALKRELREEVDAKADKVIPLGVNRVDYPDNPNQREGELFYQARYVVILDELLAQTSDPATGNVWKRKFVPMTKITDYIDWGEVGNVMFNQANELYKRIS